MRVILLGPPGGGKGTQGDMIQSHYGFPRISTGDLLRRAVHDKTPRGQDVETAMARGDLVKDEIVIGIVRERIVDPDCRKGYVLDGFPRNLKQARVLESIDVKRSEAALEISLKESVLMERLSSRRSCPKCGASYNRDSQKPAKEDFCDICNSSLIQREDDRSEIIRERLRVYWEQTEPLVGYYTAKGVFHRLDGDRNVPAIFEDIRRILDVEIAKKGGAEERS